MQLRTGAVRRAVIDNDDLERLTDVLALQGGDQRGEALGAAKGGHDHTHDGCAAVDRGVTHGR